MSGFYPWFLFVICLCHFGLLAALLFCSRQRSLSGFGVCRDLKDLCMCMTTAAVEHLEIFADHWSPEVFICVFLLCLGVIYDMILSKETQREKPKRTGSGNVSRRLL